MAEVTDEVVDWEKVYSWVVHCAAPIEPGVRVDICIHGFFGNLVTQASVKHPDWDFPTRIEVKGVCYLMGMDVDGFSLHDFSVDGHRLPQEENDVFDGSNQNIWNIRNFLRLVRLTFIKYRENIIQYGENTDLLLEDCADLAIGEMFPPINNSPITGRRMQRWKRVMKISFFDIRDLFRGGAGIAQVLHALREQQEALNRISDDPATGAEDP